MLRILIADDHGLYRKGLRRALSAAFEGGDIFEAGSLDAAISLAAETADLDLILLDLNMPGLANMESLKVFRKSHPDSRVAMLSASDDRNDILNSIGAGLHGYISKSQSDDEIIAAVRDILDGRIYVPRTLAALNDDAAGLGRVSRPEAQDPVQVDASRMTPRQQEVLPLIARGLSNKEIARALNLAEPTVKIHITALLRALNVRNRTEAALMAQSVLRSASKTAVALVGVRG